MHPNITLISSFGKLTETSEPDAPFFIAEPFLANASPVNPDQENAPGFILTLIDILEYSHGLGLAHGHLSFEKLLIDAEGQLHVTGFGQHPRHADPGDDVKALGKLMYRNLSGTDWRDPNAYDSDADSAANGSALAKPIPAPLSDVLTPLLDAVAAHPNVDLNSLRSA